MFNLSVCILLMVVGSVYCPAPIAKPPKCNDYEEFKCSNSCQEKCYPKGVAVKCSGNCTNGCYCKEGYVRDDQGSCITIAQCKKCEKYEDYYSSNRCVEACNHDKCSPDYDTYDCYCMEGFLRDLNGKCVPKCDCGSCGDHETYRCSNDCVDACNHDICTKECTYGCYCEDGFQRDKNGTCIPKCDCKKCGKHEVFKCGDSCKEKCYHYNDPVMKCDGDCTYGCYCEDGYVRNDDGKCIPKSHCKQCGPFEEYTCSNTCLEKCWPPYIAVDCIRTCTPDCYCKEGYKRDSNGRCVTYEECRRGECDKNEVSSCSYDYLHHCPCPQPTDYTVDPNQPCTFGCFCDDGYKQSDNGTCIPENKCPKHQKCPVNEEYNTGCFNPCTESCNAAVIRCRDMCRLGGCKCKEGYCRNNEGVCQEQCPPNEGPGCGNPCLDSCDKSKICPQYCMVNGCSCLEGYCRNHSGKCVPNP